MNSPSTMLPRPDEDVLSSLALSLSALSVLLAGSPGGAGPRGIVLLFLILSLRLSLSCETYSVDSRGGGTAAWTDWTPHELDSGRRVGRVLSVASCVHTLSPLCVVDPHTSHFSTRSTFSARR